MRDSIAAAARARSDTLEAEDRRRIEEQRKRADSIKAPTAASEMPVLVDIGEGYRWSREELAASGALTLTDLLERVPGVTTFRSGWIGAPHVAAMMGDFTRIRVFYDGVELDALDPRMGGMNDLSFVNIWQLEEVRIERGAGEVRIHLRSWRVRSTTPSTRVDIATGDLDTNGYRGFFGRRFTHGEVLQLGAYQYSTQDPRGQGDAEQLSLFGRVGWAKGGFSVDGSFVRTNRDRSLQSRDEELARPDLPRMDARYTEAYARVGYTDTTRGIWGQLIAASLNHSQNNLALPATPSTGGTNSGTGGTGTDADTDSIPERLSFTRAQYIAAFGWGRDALSLSSTTRVRSIAGELMVAPSVRLAYDTPRLALSLFGEEQPERDQRRLEASGRLLPLSWLALGGSVGRYADTHPPSLTRATSLAWRAEVGVRVKRAWFTGGLMSRDTAVLIAPVVYDTGFRSESARAMTGTFVRFRGKFWKDVGVDVSTVQWDSGGAFRPEYQTRSQLYVNTGWLSRFPSGNFNVLAAVTHEYRTVAYFPLATGDPLRSSQYRTLDFLLEIRLLQATLTYQFRNALNAQFTQLPGFPMHRPAQVYGVRWHFFN